MATTLACHLAAAAAEQQEAVLRFGALAYKGLPAIQTGLIGLTAPPSHKQARVGIFNSLDFVDCSYMSPTLPADAGARLLAPFRQGGAGHH